MLDISAALYPAAQRYLGWGRATPPCSNLNMLPADILFEITSHLSTLSDILQLSLVSSNVYTRTISAIYGSVELHGPAQCEATLKMLAREAEVAWRVRKLVVRPEKKKRSGRRENGRLCDDAGDISRIVAQTARRLDGLYTFEWDGEDMLPDDRMWAALQECCPGLRYVGTAFGCFLPHPKSHLFNFSALTGFSLVFKDGFYAHELHVRSRENEVVFNRLWDMLAKRCPHLESLAILGTSAEPSDIFPLHKVHWPCLRQLTVSDLLCGLGPTLNPPPFHPFLDFLERHSTLERLHILGHSTHLHPLDLVHLKGDAVPQLTEFTGSLDHLRALITRGQGTDGGGNANGNAQMLWGPQWGQPVPSSNSPLSRTLTKVCLPEPMQLRELTPLSISRVLVDLTALTSLKITFALHSGYDSNGVFRTIVASCPQLLHLDLACTNKPSFYLDSFSRSVKKFGRLRSLNLTIVKYNGEEAMHVGATRIALANPRLIRFTINYIPAHSPALPPPLETGSFALMCDTHSLPVNLYVSEWRVILSGGSGGGLVWRTVLSIAMILGIGVGTGWRRSRHGWTRRWICELRPNANQEALKKGLGELLFEFSPAGEEARLLALCISLLSLALWGIVWRVTGYVPPPVANV